MISPTCPVIFFCGFAIRPASRQAGGSDPSDPGSGVHHHEHRVESRLVAFKPLQHGGGHFLGRPGPGVDNLVVPLAIGDAACAGSDRTTRATCRWASSRMDCFSGGTIMSSMPIVIPARVA